MRIAIYTDTFLPTVNGVSTSIYNLANNLAQEGHQVLIQAPRHQKSDYQFSLHPNIEMYLVRSVEAKIYPDYRFGMGLPLSYSKIKEFNPDVIHVHTPLSIGIEGAFIAKQLKVPAIYTFHTYFEDMVKILRIPSSHTTDLLLKGGWRLIRSFCNLFDLVIAPTQAVAHDLAQHKVQPPVVALANILDEKMYQPKQQFNSQNNKLIYLGRLSREKRVDLLLKTLAILRENNKTEPNKQPPFTLDIIGDGPQRDNLFDLSFKLHINEAITWWGQVDHQTMISQKLLHHGDIFVSASRYETQGLSGLEAMAHGLPVVTIASHTSQEIIGSGGLIVKDQKTEQLTAQELATGIQKLSQQDSQQLSQQAYATARQYSASHLIPRYEELYNNLVDSADN